MSNLVPLSIEEALLASYIIETQLFNAFHTRYSFQCRMSQASKKAVYLYNLLTFDNT